VLLAADGLPAFEARKPRWLPLDRCGWVVAVPVLLLLADWQGRVWLGEMPSDSRQAVSMPGRLRATGDEHGELLVESLDGGPAFYRMPDDPDRMVSFVLFSDSSALIATDRNGVSYWKLTPSTVPFFSLVLAVGIVIWIALPYVPSEGGIIHVDKEQQGPQMGG
jgi:hypothetical protein